MADARKQKRQQDAGAMGKRRNNTQRLLYTKSNSLSRKNATEKMQEAKLTPGKANLDKLCKARIYPQLTTARGLAAQSLRPCCEGVPGCGLADGEAYLLHDDEEGAGPNGGAMNFARGPQIVSREKEQESVGEERRNERFPVNHGKGPAGDGGDHDSDRGYQDDALVGGRVEAGAKCAKNEHSKNEHIRHGDDVEGFHIEASGRVRPGERLGGRQDAEDDHKTSEEETSDAETAVDIHAASGDKRGLRYEQQDPCGKNSAVNVNDQTWQGRVEYTGEIVGVRKA